jgi:FkbH-like protein
LNEGGAIYALRPQSLTSRVEEFNRQLRAFVALNAPKCLLVDWERIVMLIGNDAAFDLRMAYVAAAPFRQKFLNLYAHEIFRVGRTLRGLSNKCLILDCDGTLWGGIVGEAGIEGIELNPNEYPGKAYYDFQRAVLRLAGEGIMIALCSKNNADEVTAVLDRHPHCLIKREHLVAARINWHDKERNIQELVTDLNIGMNAVVFVDDSAIECARIKAFLPDMTVRVVPQRLYELPLLLDAEGLFDKLATTKEDLARTEMHREEERRRENAKTFATADEFLSSIDIRAQIRAARAVDIARISQLTQKTNQFNLTTRRYSEGEIEQLAASGDYGVYSLTARDRFGDLGLTGVFIARRDGAGAHVDTLLMSCRVLGRRLEDQFVVECLTVLNRHWHPLAWSAEYIKTGKNDQVANFWPKFGFKPAVTEEPKIVYGAETTTLRLQPIPFITLEGAAYDL